MWNNNVPPGMIAITPNDTTQLGLMGLKIYGAGNVTLVDSKGQTTTFTSPGGGEKIDLQISVVKATGTTATGIFGFQAQ